jgi:NAD(P)H-dependent FMN reductase
MSGLDIVVVYGSVREGRLGIRAALWIQHQLKLRKHKVTLIDPKKYKFGILKKMYKEYPKGTAPQQMQNLARIFAKCDAVVVVSGEYNHSIPPALTNLIDHFMEEYFFTPSAIVSYSVGTFGGVRAAMQLRTLLPEVGMPTIPTIFPISKIQDVFDKGGNLLDPRYAKRVGKFLDELEWFAHAFKSQRKKGVPY